MSRLRDIALCGCSLRAAATLPAPLARVTLPALAVPLARVALLALAVPLAAQTNVFATKVIAADTRNNAGTGIFKPANALGAPSGLGGGAGSQHVHSLGIGGSLTLGFAVAMRDGPGADFVVFENAFFAGGGRVFAEVMFVEVSSNGTDFARFPSRYLGPSLKPGAFDVHWPGEFSGLAGMTPVYAGQAGVDAQDVVAAGGDAFDLADLAAHPLVLAKKVDLQKITQVRLIDVVAGQSRDSTGRPILDPTGGSADVDAVALLHHANNKSTTGPAVGLVVPSSGDVSITLSDPNGLTDLDPRSLGMALDGVAFPPLSLLTLMKVSNASTSSVTFRLGTSLPPAFRFRMSVAVKDKSGQRSGVTRTRR